MTAFVSSDLSSCQFLLLPAYQSLVCGIHSIHRLPKTKIRAVQYEYEQGLKEYPWYEYPYSNDMYGTRQRNPGLIDDSHDSAVKLDCIIESGCGILLRV